MRTRQLVLVVLYIHVEWLDFSVLVHIRIIQNDPVLTEIWSSPSCNTLTKTLTQHENTQVDFGGLLCVERTSLKCISTYNYLAKRPSTHRDMVFPSSWYLQQKLVIAQ